MQQAAPVQTIQRKQYFLNWVIFISLLFQLSSTSEFPKKLLWETVEWWHRVWMEGYKSHWEVPSLMLMAAWNWCSPGHAGNSFSQLQSWGSSTAHLPCRTTLGASLPPESHFLPPHCADVQTSYLCCFPVSRAGPVPRLSDRGSESVGISCSRIVSSEQAHLLYGQDTSLI